MLGHRLLLATNIIVNIFFSEDFLNTKVFNLGSSNVILDMFRRTGVQKCHTHTAPLFPLNRTQNKLPAVGRA